MTSNILLPYRVPGGLMTGSVQQSLTFQIEPYLEKDLFFCYRISPDTFCDIEQATMSFSMYVNGQLAFTTIRSLPELLKGAVDIASNSVKQINYPITGSIQDSVEAMFTYQLQDFTLAQNDFLYDVYIGLKPNGMGGTVNSTLGEIHTL